MALRGDGDRLAIALDEIPPFEGVQRGKRRELLHFQRRLQVVDGLFADGREVEVDEFRVTRFEWGGQPFRACRFGGSNGRRPGVVGRARTIAVIGTVPALIAVLLVREIGVELEWPDRRTFVAATLAC